MFNLIISIIAIALVVVLAIASLYYGSDAFNEGKLKAEAAQLRNEGSQIASAAMVYKARGGDLSSVDFTLNTLVEQEYLKKVPENWSPDTDVLIYPIDSSEHPKAENLCFVANKQAGFTFDALGPSMSVYSLDTTMGIPQCIDGLDPMLPCCVVP